MKHRIARCTAKQKMEAGCNGYALDYTACVTSGKYVTIHAGMRQHATKEEEN